MVSFYRLTSFVLLTIVVIGLIAIPFGNPRFIDGSIILELSFIALFILIWKRYHKALYACIPLAILVIIGNSLAPPHINLMITFSKPFNAIILIIGGYVLQGILVYSSLMSLLKIRAGKLITD